MGYGSYHGMLWYPIVIVHEVCTAWNQLPSEGQIVAGIWIVLNMSVEATPRIRLSLSRHSEEERGIVECILRVYIAKEPGFRCREGPRAEDRGQL
jgi:hypothetical protein